MRWLEEPEPYTGGPRRALETMNAMRIAVVCALSAGYCPAVLLRVRRLRRCEYPKPSECHCCCTSCCECAARAVATKRPRHCTPVSRLIRPAPFLRVCCSRREQPCSAVTRVLLKCFQSRHRWEAAGPRGIPTLPRSRAICDGTAIVLPRAAV